MFPSYLGLLVYSFAGLETYKVYLFKGHFVSATCILFSALSRPAYSPTNQPFNNSQSFPTVESLCCLNLWTITAIILIFIFQITAADESLI